MKRGEIDRAEELRAVEVVLRTKNGPRLVALLFLVFFFFSFLGQLYWWRVRFRQEVYVLFRSLARLEMELVTLGWERLEGEHFVIKFRPEDREVAPLILQNAEKVYRPVTEALDYRPGGKIMVVVYPDRFSLNKSFGWDGDQSAMGVYWAGVIRLLSPLDWAPGPAEQMTSALERQGPVVHELTHLLLDYITQGNYPRWLTEGIAQYYEQRITGYTLPGAKTTGRLYRLEEMEAGFDSLSDQFLAYRQSLLFVCYLEEKYGSGTAVRILPYLRKGFTVDQALQEVTGKPINQLEEEWLNWLRQNPRLLRE